MEENNNDFEVESTFRNLFMNPNLPELAADNAEAILDSLLKGEVLEALPILGSFVKGRRLVNAVVEHHFTKKLFYFMTELRPTSAKQRAKFIAKLDSHGNKRQGAGETMITILARLDHVSKATILGKLLVAQLQEKLPLERFLRLAFAVENTFLGDLKILEAYEGGATYHSGISESLCAQGLIYSSLVINRYGGRKQEGDEKYDLTLLGIEYLKFAK